MPEVNLEERFLVVAPTGRDAPLTCALLAKAGLAAEARRTVEELVAEAQRGAAALIVAEEVLTPEGMRRIADLVAAQEPWSDLPILLFTGEGAMVQARRPTLQLLAPLGNVTLLDRPLQPITMVTVAQAALRARRRQYATRAEIERQRAAVRQRDEFLAILGHEIRNPLGAITLAAELLVRRPGGDPLGEQIRRQAQHLARLVDDLLDVSRVSSGKLVLKRQALAVDELLRRCVETVRPMADARQTVITLEAPPVTVDGDPVRLEQIFGNLLTNAVKYTPPGGHVTVTATARADEVRVDVTDDGAGLEPDMLDRVFEPFVQAHHTLDRAQGGLGIGLTLVRALVELHGGRVSAASEGLGRGSTFSVMLPIGGATRATTGATSVAPAPTKRRLNVLIIEDNPDSRELLRQLVEGFGHRVELAVDGLDGLEAAIARRPDVMLVDIGLPRLDGYEVARGVLARGLRPLLVAITGYGQPSDRAAAQEAGFHVHCTKPVDPRKLELLLAEAGESASA